ncbi:NAD-dependent protein lipoamidase sirtuin-4, mitochondrial-like [Gigantopelta aegis]|uniref:NAD-dependent protein lipoamidase sirtuin-4, mitochondrial-like n=1 Tax=Gigantopelta aegis TaxID=1735272 RepID=UPI001B889CEC|nr:NAD-dependent protein lipoamidase sirtuin-4, mitochondrial-like [Gigantopelta aegis]
MHIRRVIEIKELERILMRSKSTFSIKSKPKCFVPKSEPPDEVNIYRLQHFIDKSKHLFVITGAGLSTESGIPDYRSEGVGLYATSSNRPVQYKDFLKSADIRRRYWARNFVGWPRFSSFLPNVSHQIFRQWEVKNKINWLVTQNVDALHCKAGSTKVTELHGSSHRVECLTCKQIIPRNRMQEMIISLNPDWHEQSFDIAPDGDVNLKWEQVEGFKVPPCDNCGGILKPNIIFFGDNVPREVVSSVFDQLDKCDAVLVAGSSLQVFSGFRFVSKAHDDGKPISIVNIGSTRADHLASIKISAQCGKVLSQIDVDL